MPTDPTDPRCPFSLPSIGKKKATAAFAAGHIHSDRGVLLLAGADQRLGPIDSRAALIPDHCDAKPLNLKRLPDRVFTRSSQQDGRPGRHVIYP
jgi:hypothetical protein